LALARINGLPRLAFLEAEALPAFSPVLLFADATAAPLPPLPALPTLRALAVECGDAAMVRETVTAVASGAGLAPEADLTRETTRVFRRQ
jgi:hypothetical protein